MAIDYCVGFPLVKLADFLNNFCGLYRIAKIFYWMVYGVMVLSSNIVRPFVSAETRTDMDAATKELKQELGLY